MGILGAPEAGKTACLVSLYLLLAHDRLGGFEFCDSRSLMAFEEISRGARRWNEGEPPQEMTSHTELADARTAGFLHLRLRKTGSDERFDLLLPDLPGEWSASFIDSNRVDRLDFLKSADVIWLMIDGSELTDLQTRQLAAHRACVLFQRVTTFLAPTVPPIVLVVTRLDAGKPPAEALASLEEEAAARNVSMTIVHVASFTAGNTSLSPGAGLADLLESAVRVGGEAPTVFWAIGEQQNEHRAVLRFRSSGETR